MLYKTRIYIKNTLRCMLRMYGAFIIHAHLDLHICNSNEPSLNNFIDCVVVSVYRASPQSPRAKLTSFYDRKMFRGNILRHLKTEKKVLCWERPLLSVLWFYNGKDKIEWNTFTLCCICVVTCPLVGIPGQFSWFSWFSIFTNTTICNEKNETLYKKYNQ